MRPVLVAALIAAGLGLLVSPGVGAPTAYELDVPKRLTVTRGDSGAISLTIAPRSGYTVSREGPLRVDVSAVPDTGLALTKTHYTRDDAVNAADAVANSPQFDVGYEATLPGGYAVAIDVRFWICRKRTCRPVRETRTVDVAVEEPAPPAPSPTGDAGVASDGA